jgi:signal transduction histidine kinase
MLVTLETRLLQSVPRSANPQLVLQDGTIIFTARLEDAGQGWKIPALESGSVVRLSGVCSIQRGEQGEAKSFRLRLRSPADVVLLSAPPWWSARQILWVFGGLGLVLLVSLAWVGALRQQVRRQTRTLREEIAERERMEVQIEKTHQELLNVSRQAGMAEIATNVLHNVGNVLNSVNISTGLIVESVRKSRASSLARVVVLLEEHAHDLGAFITNDARGKHVPAHLAQISKHLLADQEAIVGELDSLRGNVEHIKEIVAMQQSFATFGGVKETVNLVTLVEDSLRVNAGALSRHRVEVIREFGNVPPMNVEKHKILQILVNLLRNAKHACQDSDRPDGRMTVRVANGDGWIKISVIDNGVGIPPENLTRIFNHGFTTRKDGHGFGLHSGALAAKEMGGSLTVHSDGPGQGAAFTLALPCPTPENSRG